MITRTTATTTSESDQIASVRTEGGSDALVRRPLNFRGGTEPHDVDRPDPRRATPAPSSPAARAVDLVKTYGKGEAVGPCARRHQRRVRTRKIHRGDGPLRLGKVHPDALHGRTGHTDLGPRLCRGAGDRSARRRRSDPDAPGQDRLRLPVVQSGAHPHRRTRTSPCPPIWPGATVDQGLVRLPGRRSSALATGSLTGRPRCPAANSNGPRAPVR